MREASHDRLGVCVFQALDLLRGVARGREGVRPEPVHTRPRNLRVDRIRNHRRANMAHIRQSRPDSGLGFQGTVLQTCDLRKGVARGREEVCPEAVHPGPRNLWLGLRIGREFSFIEICG